MENQNIKIKILAVLGSIALLFSPIYIYAEVLGSPNYKIINPELNGGGQGSSSANYKSYDGVDTSADPKSNSTNYNLFPGLILPLFPNVPGIPTFQNTTGQQYNSLDFVLSIDANSSDTNYAIAISSDNFVTTNFVQADDSIGPSTVWQTFAQWGSASGQRIIGLNSSTTYKIKVKARYHANSETAYSGIATAATSAAILTVSITGVSSGTNVAGVVTNVTTTSQNVSYGTLSNGSIKLAAQTVTVTTNANNGYSVSVQEDRDLSRTDGVTIAPVTSSNASPAAWPTGVTRAYFGYHTTKSPLCSGTTTRFSANDTFAALTTSPAEISCNTGPVTSDVATLLFKLEIESLQPAGDYRNKITYITTASY